MEHELWGECVDGKIRLKKNSAGEYSHEKGFQFLRDPLLPKIMSEFETDPRAAIDNIEEYIRNFYFKNYPSHFSSKDDRIFAMCTFPYGRNVNEQNTNGKVGWIHSDIHEKVNLGMGYAHRFLSGTMVGSYYDKIASIKIPANCIDEFDLERKFAIKIKLLQTFNLWFLDSLDQGAAPLAILGRAESFVDKYLNTYADYASISIPNPIPELPLCNTMFMTMIAGKIEKNSSANNLSFSGEIFEDMRQGDAIIFDSKNSYHVSPRIQLNPENLTWERRSRELRCYVFDASDATAIFNDT